MKLRTFLLAGLAFTGLAATPASALNIVLRADSGFLSQARRLQLLKAETPAEALNLLDEAAKNSEQGVTW